MDNLGWHAVGQATHFHDARLHQARHCGLKQLAHAMMDASMAYEALSNTTRDHREALDAIRDKRKADFTGD